MQKIEGMRLGDVKVDADSTVTAMVQGDLIVCGSYHVIVTGMIAGNIIASDGAKVEVNGVVGGHLIGENFTGNGMVANWGRS